MTRSLNFGIKQYPEGYVSKNDLKRCRYARRILL